MESDVKVGYITGIYSGVDGGMEGGEGEEKLSKRSSKLLFWNVAGIGRQDLEFWEFIVRHDFIWLCETWVDSKGWIEVKGKLPTLHEWVCKYAEKKNVKGKACGGIIVDLRKSWGKGKWELIESKYEGILHVRIKNGVNKNALEENEAINILVVYNSVYKEDIGGVIERVLEERENEKVIVGGDFNIRIGELGKRGRIGE